jgi:MoaA/NifB/PqqE/SkfB family radical SAM enzyme
MWKEWLSPYNSFNSVKLLTHSERIEKIRLWLDEAPELPPPLTVYVDPTNLCNVNCFWCKNKAFRQAEARSITDNQLMELPTFLKEWDVRSMTVSGGEPLLHPKIVPFMQSAAQLGLAIGLKTNGYNLSKEDILKAVAESCQWVGVSVDAATEVTYSKVKKAPLKALERVLAGIEALVKARGPGLSRITMKFLVHHSNFAEMYAFAQLAKNVGVNEVHFRPISLDRYRYVRGVCRTAAFYLREARKDFEDDNFKIYGPVSKFDSTWARMIRFKRCLVTSLFGVFAANGLFYLCPDRRGDKNLTLGKFYPFADFKPLWGSDAHRAAVKKITPQLCQKCGYNLDNEVIEHGVLNDDMLVNFI